MVYNNIPAFTCKGTSLAAAILAAGLVDVPQASAHHALEYIDTSSYTLTEQGQGIAYLLYDNQSPDRDDPGFDRWEFTPGISYGITDWLMIDGHAHYAKFGANHLDQDFVDSFSGDARDRIETLGASPMLESATLGAQVAIPRFNDWVDVGFLFQAEFPLSQARRALGDEDRAYFSELILHHDAGDHFMLTANIGNETVDSDHEQYWRLGTRTPISPNPDGIAAGLELEGSFEDSDWTVMPGIFAPITRNAIAKMGYQVDGEDFEATRFHASLMYIF